MYVDAYYCRNRDKMFVIERVNGKRNIITSSFEHVLYYYHPSGQHRTIHDQPCKRFSTTSSRKFHAKKKELQTQKKPPLIFESDIRPEFRHLAKHYSGANTPKLNVGFFDIETDFDPDRGFSSPEDAFSSITAITVYLTHEQKLHTMALKPPTLTLEEAEAIGRKFSDTIIFDNEADLLEYFFKIVEDVDVFSGWNSEGYDIPYMINRTRIVLGSSAVKRFCLNGENPRPRTYMKFGREMNTYDLVGRSHLDYLILYQKHNPQQQQSYRLDYIAEQEVGDNKTPYEGTLDGLYKNDFFLFIEYNRQDVNLLVKIDEKRKFIELANQIAHANCVLLKTTVGSVALVEAAIINEMHAMGFVVPDKKSDDDVKLTQKTQLVYNVDQEKLDKILEEYVAVLSDEEWENMQLVIKDKIEDDFFSVVADYLKDKKPEIYDTLCQECMKAYIEYIDIDEEEESDDETKTPVVGAYVAKPKTGIHKHVACIDINSLYPSCIRALNMSPETIIGQVRPDATMALVEKRIANKVPRAEAWDGIFCLLEVDWMHNKTNDSLIIDFEDGTSVCMTGAELYDYIYAPENQVCISANGTIFTTAKDGIIPKLLEKWYSQRKEQQAKQKAFAEMAMGIDVPQTLLGDLVD